MNIQPSEYITSNGLGWYEGNVVKYISRHHQKGGREDILKVIHYCELLLEDYDKHYISDEEWDSIASNSKDWDVESWEVLSHPSEQNERRVYLSAELPHQSPQLVEQLELALEPASRKPVRHTPDRKYVDLDGQYSTLYYYAPDIGSRW